MKKSEVEIKSPLAHSRDRRQAATISLIVSVGVLALKFWAYSQTHSSAVLSDAFETIVNVIAALVALMVIRYVAKPKDEDHPYGHGKVEYFSAAFEGGMILFASITIFIEGFNALRNPRQLTEIEQGILFVSVATLLNVITSLYLRRIGEKQKSETLLASSAHLMSDVVTTFGVLAGLGLYRLTGWPWIDGVVALLIAGQLLYEGFRIVRRSVAGLTDEIDGKSLLALSRSIQKHRHPGIIDIHQVRAIRSGSFHHIDAHLVVPEFWDVARVHDLCHGFEAQVIEDYPFDGEFAFHVDPCQKKYCSVCDVANCPIRQRPFEKIRDFAVADLISGPQPADPSV